MKKATESPKTKPKIQQHQDFDNVAKKTFSRVYQSIIHKLFGLDIKNAVKIPTSFSRTKEKRSDFAIKVSRPNEKPHIVHIEFQSDGDKNMDRRELGYYSDFYWEYGLEIIQYVIYLGSGDSKMPIEVKHSNLNFRYTVIEMNKIDVDLFLNSDNPHEIVLAVLCKYTRRQAPKIIKKILEKLRAKTKSERDLHEYVTDLEILSSLRNLQSETKKELEKMPIIYDLRKDIRFKEGKEEGLEEKARLSTIRALEEGSLSAKKIAKILDVPLDFVLQIQQELEKKNRTNASSL